MSRPGDSEGTFQSSSQAATCPPVYQPRGGFTLSLLMPKVKQEAANTNFYSLWFDLIGSRTLVYRRSIHLMIQLWQIGTEMRSDKRSYVGYGISAI